MSCKDKSCKCPSSQTPVCGTDGTTYGSACAAECYDVDYTKGECPAELDGTVKIFGYPTDEACNLFIFMGRNFYMPMSLDTAFHYNNLEVKLTFRGFGDFVYCDTLKKQVSKIEVLKIEKK